MLPTIKAKDAKPKIDYWLTGRQHGVKVRLTKMYSRWDLIMRGNDGVEYVVAPTDDLFTVCPPQQTVETPPSTIKGKDAKARTDYWLTGRHYGVKVRLARMYKASGCTRDLIMRADDGREYLVYESDELFVVCPPQP